MAKKFLAVAVDKYPVPAELEASVLEADNWLAKLRDVYGFDILTPLYDENATHDNVVYSLEHDLLKDAREGDELVFAFCGHGSVVTKPGQKHGQESLFLFPDRGLLRASDALLTASEFADIVTRVMNPAAHLTVILQTCFAAGFGDVPAGQKSLYIELEPGVHADAFTMRFGDVSDESGSRRQFTSPALIFAATGRNQRAVQLPSGPSIPARMLFSKLALEELERNRDDTYAQLRDVVKKKSPYEKPDLYGNVGRAGEHFGGGVPSSARPTAQRHPTAAAGTRTLTVRIAGTCCFVAAYSDENPFTKRVVLPFDSVARYPEERHIPYIEVPMERVLSGADYLTSYYHAEYELKAPRCGYSNDLEQIEYGRYEFFGHTVAIEDVDESQPLTVTNAFWNHVPRMTAAEPRLFPVPRPEVFLDEPPAGLISAFFDIRSGILDAGTLYDFVTQFYRPLGELPTAQYQTPRFVQLLLTLAVPEGKPLTIRIAKGNNIIKLELDELTDVITIGNQPLDSIRGLEGKEDIGHHFHLYYNLATPPPPENPAVPVTTGDPTNSCTVTTWP